ncbi:hypothetical protein FBT96_01290 [Rhodobacter capsulatus]|uniref:Uncharacterized protein n=1 Tax=Rhodobacter capsulatus TaxID=1061 RepID=A0A4U1K3M2_RHOCA|nr:hypothetical protein [Rhodobacter capsulatus]TKD25999.1 hypothetical protein FBT96_01290 [Rhodobacter capsulatus]
MEFLSKEILAGLREATRRESKRPARLSVHAGGRVWPILKRWSGGFSLDAAQVTNLRGHVQIFDGERPIATALIVAAEVDGFELICSTKRETPVRHGPALDFEREDRTPPLGFMPPA